MFKEDAFFILTVVILLFYLKYVFPAMEEKRPKKELEEKIEVEEETEKSRKGVPFGDVPNPQKMNQII